MSNSENSKRPEDEQPKNSISRRGFVKLAGAMGFGGLVAGPLVGWLTPASGQIISPLESYPDRDWEKAYRDLFRYDDSYTFLCTPNDTHGCLLRAYVKNGVISRIGPTYGYGDTKDLYGNRASKRWDPRCCNKGLALTRRFYGDRRVRGPMVRKGFKAWVDKGFPRDPKTGKPPVEYFNNRGKDEWLQVSWDEAFTVTAKATENIARTYSGTKGADYLKAQDYEDVMVDDMKGAGTRTLKVRGGMPLLGLSRMFAQYRMANSFALLDSKIRGVGADKARGGRGWDNYTWHTDLPPGHPMVTGQQTSDWDLFAVENAKLFVNWGMNWICTKMPDAHWLTEARLRGTKVFTVATEYQSTANKADEIVILRPGTDPAFALGVAGVIMREKLYDKEAVANFTDLPLLVRMDNLQMLRATDLDKNHRPADLKNYINVTDKKAPPWKQDVQYVSPSLRKEWDDFMMWDTNSSKPAVVTRDQVGKNFKDSGVKPKLEGEFKVKLADGKKVKVSTIFSLVKKYIDESLDIDTVSDLCRTPKEGIISLARQIAANPSKTLIATGMGPNQMFNGDLKDRGVYLVAALTDNLGHIGGNLGSYAGNYRAALFNGIPQFAGENPFDIELDPNKLARPKKMWQSESAHHWNYGDRTLRAGKHVITGKSHMPNPTKAAFLSNPHSILGNAKWHYDVVNNTLPRMELIAVNEWWWTGSCEYADVVFAVEAWSELSHPDLYGAVTNPFLQAFPVTPLKKFLNTKNDIEVHAGICAALGDITGDKRFVDYWKFVKEGRTEVYLQRILDAGSATRGVNFKDLEDSCAKGTPSLMLTRTYPRSVGWEQRQESKPWYTKSGRAEFYREEQEFVDSGENMPVHREPIDSTFYEPNVIVAKDHPALNPKTPADYGITDSPRDAEIRQVRHVVKPWSKVSKTRHPLTEEDEGYKFIFYQPKYRHGAHTTGGNLDINDVLFGPFGDIMRRDKRKPATGEGYADINPLDLKEMGIEDGDYIWVDADPRDRPYRGWKAGTESYEVARCMLRARYYPGTPRGVSRIWFNMYSATFGSVRGGKIRPDGLCKNPVTNYQALFRSGSHQSATRAWLKPTWETDSLVRKGLLGQKIGKGFCSDVHCANGAPREAFVKFTFAEKGGIGGVGLWHPAAKGLRPTYESKAMKNYMAGNFLG